MAGVCILTVVMWQKLPLLCCVFLYLGLNVAFDVQDILEKSVPDFVIGWQSRTVAARQRFQHSVHALLNQQPDNQTLISAKGLIDFANGDIYSSIAAFRKACVLSGYEDTAQILRLADVLETNNTYGAIDSLVVALQKRNYLSYSKNIPLFQRLINTFHATKGEEESYTRLIQVIQTLPTIYAFWVQYADAHLTRYFGLPRAGNQPTARQVSWNASELYFLYYGLSLFPRCPELLYLRALQYIAEGELSCAMNFAQRALHTRHLQFGIFKDVYYTDLVSWLVETGVDLESINTADLNQTCMPYLLHHAVEDYQRVHEVISGAASVDLPERTDMTPDTAPNDVFNRSVHKYDAYLVPDDGSPMERTTRYLPSLQVGCSSHSECARPGFLIADAAQSITTHFLTQACDLSMIQTSSIGLLYSSHTLEHLSHQNPPPSCVTYPISNMEGDKSCYPELNLALSEWRRVLAPNGKILLSVPDLTALATFFLNPNASKEEKLQIRTVMYGGQVDQYDFHKNGFYWDYLRDLLVYHKFCDIERVKTFDLFLDASYTYEIVSLSVQARAC